MGWQVLSLLGPLGICIMLLVLGELSHRLGRVTRVPPYYYGFQLGALLMGLNVLLHLLLWIDPPLAPIFFDERFQALVFVGFPAFSFTLGLGVAWRYWSWLLAERA